ncbi:MAG: GreA/GreB family elongation factor, partial [Clostridia bacterium]|nr:GreA/GreB family elongation factor [Clostridia bacterium]
STDKVHVGSKVKLKDIEYDETVEYKIVGSSEADPREGRISDESPVGEALIGHKKGQTVKVKTPSGVLKYKILEISK